jgi:hypothetical protein
MSKSSSSCTSNNKPSPDGASAREVYEATGDASAALQLLMPSSSSSSSSSSESSPSQAYNRSLLQAMNAVDSQSNAGADDLWKQLPALEAQILQATAATSTTTTSSSRKRRLREEWTLTYNRGLLLLAQGQANMAMATVWKVLEPIVVEDNSSNNKKKQLLSQDLLAIACRMGLLMVEGILTLAVGNPLGIPKEWHWKDPNTASCDGDHQTTLPVLNLESFLRWLFASVERTTPPDQQHPLKFSLALYTARMGFLDRSSDGKLSEAQIRSARKELKQAMEIYQHKLKPASGGDAGSMASSSVLSENNTTSASSINNNNNNSHHPYDSSQAALTSPLLQRLNQAGLNLKANTEQLKGNIKKSLILCSEAQAAEAAAAGSSSSAYDALHYNNLAIVYETHGKPHLALHAWSKAVAASTTSSSNNANSSSSSSSGVFVERDGTARLDTTCKILWNAAMGSLQARNFWAAYECLGTCLEHSEIWCQQGRAWLRLGESCIGIWATRQRQGTGGDFSAIHDVGG